MKAQSSLRGKNCFLARQVLYLALENTFSGVTCEVLSVNLFLKQNLLIQISLYEQHSPVVIFLNL